MGSSGVEAVDRKQKIRDRYKGVDASELEVIPACCGLCPCFH